MLGVLLTSAPRMQVLSSSRRSEKLVDGNEEREKSAALLACAVIISPPLLLLLMFLSFPTYSSHPFRSFDSPYRNYESSFVEFSLFHETRPLSLSSLSAP